MGKLISRPKDKIQDSKDGVTSVKGGRQNLRGEERQGEEKQDKSAFFTWTLPWSKDKEQTTKEQETEMSAEEDKKKEKAARKKHKGGFFSRFHHSDDEGQASEKDTTDDEEDKEKKFKDKKGITLYSAQSSPNARKVKMVLLHKNLKYREIVVDLIKGEQMCEEYLRINPNGKVPTVTFRNVKGVQDCILTDSLVITEFLDRVYPTETPLLIGMDNELLLCKMWQDWEAGLSTNMSQMLKMNVFPLMLRMTYKSREEFRKSLNKAASQKHVDQFLSLYDGKYMPSLKDREDAASICYRNLFKLEHALEGKDFLVIDIKYLKIYEKFSMADLIIFPRVEMFTWSGLPIKKNIFPNITAYIKRMSSVPCVKNSENRNERFMRRIFTYADWFVEAVGNWKSGNKLNRFDGSKVLPRVVADDNRGDILEPAPIPDVPQRAIVVYSYPLAAETWMVKTALREMGINFREERCDWLDLIGRPMGTSGIFRIQRGDQLYIGSRTMLEAIDSFGWMSSKK